MVTVVRAGSGTRVVVATGGQAEFGRIALGLGEHHPETAFQVGLRKFSMLLVQVAGVLTAAIFIINVVLHRPVIDALLFSLAIAVGISPQLLPLLLGLLCNEAVVTDDHAVGGNPRHADAPLFGTGWFVESLATQTLVIFAIAPGVSRSSAATPASWPA